MTDGVVSIAKHAIKALASRQLDPQTSYKLFTRCALEQFPDSKNEAEATEKFRKTVHGQEWFNAERKQNYEDMQKGTALSATVPITKFWGNEGSRQSEFENPDVTRRSGKPRLPDGGAAAGPPGWDGVTPAVFGAAVERLMKEQNISRDAAITEIYRAEKMARGASW
jgi:hypothetical protein